MAGPLSGIRVVEMANFISGPYAGMLLADLGAEVIKVEMPGTGDPFRKWGGHRGGARPQFVAYNRGKHSVTINVKQADGREAYRRLVATSDVVVENFRPGVMDRLGIGYEAMRPDNPGLVYCGISGMGQTGPYARRPSYDSIGIALSGLWSRLASLKEPRPIGPNLGDQLTSVFAVYGILGALLHRDRSGRGQRVDVNLLLSSMAFLTEPITNYLSLGEVGGIDTRARRSQTYALLAADDLPLTVHISSVQKFWEGLTRAVGRPDLREDPRFQTNVERVKHYDELEAELQNVIGTRDRRYWLDILEAEDVPSAPIHSIADAVESPEARHLEAIREYGSGDRQVRLVRCPVDYSEFPLDPDLPPPELGEHTHEIMTSLGYSDAEITRLRAEAAL